MGLGDRRKRSEELSRVLKGPVASPSWGGGGGGVGQCAAPEPSQDLAVSVVVVCQPLWGGASEKEQSFFSKVQ